MPVKDTSENIRIRLDDAELRERWRQTLAARKISQQQAVVSLIHFITEQDPLTQAMIFEQVPETDRSELSRIVLRRMGTARPRRKG